MLYNQGNCPIFRDLISNTNWKSTFSKQPNVDIADELFTGKFLKIADECIRTNTKNNKIWMTSEIRRELRVRDRLRKKFIQRKIILMNLSIEISTR